MPRIPRYRAFPRGITIFYCGKGKGKTTAAMGTAVRAAGYGWNVLVLQFIKGEWPSGEAKLFATVRNITHVALGKGFVRIIGDRKPISVHRKAAVAALRKARTMIRSGRYNLVVLDEVVSAVEEGLLNVRDVTRLMSEKPERVNLLLTGHTAYPSIVAKADLVSHMQKVKHPFDKRYLAIQGIDY